MHAADVARSLLSDGGHRLAAYRPAQVAELVSIWGFPKIMGTLLGVPIIRTL